MKIKPKTDGSPEPHARPHAAQAAQLPDLDLLKVMPEPRAAELVGMSLVHMRRIRKKGTGPRFVQLGERRIGYRLKDVLDWIEVRLSEAGSPGGRR